MAVRRHGCMAAWRLAANTSDTISLCKKTTTSVYDIVAKHYDIVAKNYDVVVSYDDISTDIVVQNYDVPTMS